MFQLIHVPINIRLKDITQLQSENIGKHIWNP